MKTKRRLSRIDLYHLMLINNNSFILGSDISFPEILELFYAQETNYVVTRLISVELAWILRCLPYLLAAMCTNYWLFNIPATIILVFILANIMAQNFFSKALIEITMAYSLLLFAIAMAGKTKEHILIVNLGACSFGIYPIYPLVKSLIEIITARVLPNLTERVSILSMLVYFGLTFVII